MTGRKVDRKATLSQRIDNYCWKKENPKSVDIQQISDLVPVTGLDLHFLPLGEN